MQVRDALPSVLLVLASGASLWLGGCASEPVLKSPAAEAADQAKSTAPEHPIAEIVEATNKPLPIGALLMTLDQEITAWNNLFLMAQTEVERSKARNLEKSIMTTAYNRRTEILEQLESGPLNNRIVAAAALGFTRDPSVQSPLLAALDDPAPEVVSSALIGLWLLGRSDTPLDRIAAQLTNGETEDVRTNAALCLSTLVRAGARSASAQPALRIGMLDRAATVRAHCALALAELGDTDSFQAIADMLNEDTTLAIAAGARAIGFMAAQDNKLRGKAARALVSAWMRAEEPAKSSVFRSMVELSGTNYGTDEEEWGEVGHALALIVALFLAIAQDPPAAPPAKAAGKQAPAAAPAPLKPPPPRAEVAGMRGFETRSRLEYMAQPGRPHELRAVYVFPARVRWWISAGEGANEERRMRYQFGQHVLAVEPRQALSVEYQSEDRDALLGAFELRRVLFLWPDVGDWQVDGDGRTVAYPTGEKIRAKLAGKPARPVEMTLVGKDGKERDSLRRITWREAAPSNDDKQPARTWPATFEAWNASTHIWTETVLAVDLTTRYIDSFFVPPDRRGDVGTAKGDTRDLDIPPTCVRRVPLPAGASWDAARAERTRLATEAAAAGGPTLEEWATIEVTPDGTPAAVVLRLARVPDVVPPGFVLVPERPGTATSVSGLAQVKPELLERLRARLPAGSTPGAAYARFDARKTDPDVVVVVPLD